MSNIAFFHIGSNNRPATEYVVENIRSFHPKAPYLLASDNAINFFDVAQKHKTDYVHYIEKLGGPKQPYGYEIDSVLQFFERFRYACYHAYVVHNCEHIMMAEDDVILVNPVTVNPNWQMACHNITYGNELPIPLLDAIEEFSGKRPSSKHYGGGGGSIYNAKTFLEFYDDVIHWFKVHGDHMMKNEYPTLGWIDCFMVVYYFLCGKDYTANPNMVDTHNHSPGFDYESFISKLPNDIQIINNYKRFYFNE